jgi:outer membrane cobalamin receptor
MRCPCSKKEKSGRSFKMRKTCIGLLLLASIVARAQEASKSTTAEPKAKPETIVVTGTFTPTPLSEANRAVVSMDTQAQPLLYNSVVDYLQIDPSVDMEQRGVDGVQADLSIRGAAFEQSLVLLNGLRINDAQSGHHDMDIPVPLEAVSRIEVLHGGASTLYGADALGGVVNFLTAAPTATEVRARFGFGSFGFNQQRLEASYLGHHWSERISGSRDSSTGFRPDRDFRSSSAASETRFQTGWGHTDLLFAGSDRPFGADQFYGDFHSWERTKSWFASVHQDLGENTDVAFGYRRHSDLFVLERDNPAFYENNHVIDSWQAVVHRRSYVSGNFSLAYGLDFDGDAIDSTNLGRHARNRGAGYLNVDVHPWRRFFFSLGGREEIFSGGNAQFAPTIAGGLWCGKGVKLRASASRAYRLPTYTDLYYHDPANLGNPLLKPESAWNFEGGPEWNAGGRVSAELTVFDRRVHDGIDYVKASFNAPWQAMNIGNLNFVGAETALRIKVLQAQEITLTYTGVHASQQLSPGTISEYLLNYASHNAVFSWTGEFWNAFGVRNRVGVIERVGRDAYPLWDIAASRTTGRVRPYLELSNLSNTGYEEIPGVAMPGRSIMGGVEFVFSKVRQ